MAEEEILCVLCCHLPPRFYILSSNSVNSGFQKSARIHLDLMQRIIVNYSEISSCVDNRVRLAKVESI